MLKHILLMALMACVGWSQTDSGIARRIQWGSLLPPTCTEQQGQIFFLVSGATGSPYYCSAPGVWSQWTGGGGPGGLTANRHVKAASASTLTDGQISEDPVTSQLTLLKGFNATAVGQAFAADLEFDLALGNSFEVTLTNNVSSIAFSHLKAGAVGMYILRQDGTGGRTVTVPAGFCSMISTASKSLWQFYRVAVDGTTVENIGCVSNDTPTYIEGPERAAVTATGANRGNLTYASGSHTTEYYANNSANRHIMPRCAGSTDQCAATDLVDGSQLRLRSVPFTLSNGSSAITAGAVGWYRFPASGTLTSIELTCGPTAGDIVIDIWKDTYANFPPTILDTIFGGGSTKPTLSSATKYQDLTLTGVSATFNAGDYYKISVDSAATVAQCLLSLQYTIN